MEKLEIYSSITELPIWNFDVINRTADLSYLYIGKVPEEPADLTENWYKIYDEFLDEFGLTDKYKELIRLKKKAVKLFAQAILEDKRYLKPLAEVAWRRAEDLANTLDGNNLSETTALLSKFMGYRINIMEIPVMDFYSYIKLMEKSRG